jgi:hypothetical protein
MSFQYVPYKEGEAQQRAWMNRRASVRYQCGPATPGRVALVDKQEFLRAWILDLSAHGIGLLIPRQLDAGQRVIVTLKAASGQKTYALPAQVAHVTRHPQGEWIVGFELDRPLSSDDLDALL